MLLWSLKERVPVLQIPLKVLVNFLFIGNAILVYLS